MHFLMPQEKTLKLKLWRKDNTIDFELKWISYIYPIYNLVRYSLLYIYFEGVTAERSKGWWENCASLPQVNSLCQNIFKLHKFKFFISCTPIALTRVCWRQDKEWWSICDWRELFLKIIFLKLPNMFCCFLRRKSAFMTRINSSHHNKMTMKYHF